MFVESITLWEKSEYGSVKQQKLYKGDEKTMVDMEEKNTCIYLTIADITLITVLVLADIVIFNRTLDKITI